MATWIHRLGAAALLLPILSGCASPSAPPQRLGPRPALPEIRFTLVRADAARALTLAPDHALIPAVSAKSESALLTLVPESPASGSPASPGPAQGAPPVRIDLALAGGDASRWPWLTTQLAPASGLGPTRAGPLVPDMPGITVPAAEQPPALVVASAALSTALYKLPGELLITLSPSEGAPASWTLPVVTAAALASATGMKLDPGATVIGALAPDGTVIPVAGSEAVLARARAAGKQRIGLALDSPHGSGGARPRDVVQVRDLADAYAVLTGRRMPVTMPLDRALLALPAAMSPVLQELYRAWRKRLLSRWEAVLRVTGAAEAPPVLAELAARGSRAVAAAETLWRRGELSPAYERMVRAAVLAEASVWMAAAVQSRRSGDREALERMLAELDAYRAQAERSAEEALTASQRTAVAQPGIARDAALAAAVTAVMSRAYVRLSAQRLAQVNRELDVGPDAGGTSGRGDPWDSSREGLSRFAEELRPGLIALAEAVAYAQQSRDLLALIGVAAGPGKAAPGGRGDTVDSRRRTDAHRASAAGRLAYLKEQAGGADASLLAVAELTSEIAAELGSVAPPDAESPALGALAAALAADHVTGVVLAEHLALAGARGESGNAQATAAPPSEQARAIAAMLARAERAVRQHAHAARLLTGEIPLVARLLYWQAQSLAKEPTERLRAVELYWLASMYCRAAIRALPAR